MHAVTGNFCFLQVGSILFTVVIVTVHLEVASVFDHWTPFHHLAIWFSVCERSPPHLRSLTVSDQYIQLLEHSAQCSACRSCCP